MMSQQLAPEDEKYLILQIRNSISMTLQSFSYAILEQDSLLRYISEEFIHQEKLAKLWITEQKNRDISSKTSIVNVFCSVVRAALSVIGCQELVTITAAIIELASNSMDILEAQLSDIVSDICNHIKHSHSNLLIEAEDRLLKTTSEDELSVLWSRYRYYIFEKSNSLIKEIFDSCLLNEFFIKCLIRSILHESQSSKELVLKASSQLTCYIKNISAALQFEINKLKVISSSCQSNLGRQRIEIYFKKIYLIDYTLAHEHGSNFIQRYITRNLKKKISILFPDIVIKRRNNLNKKGLTHTFDEKKEISDVEYKELQKKSVIKISPYFTSLKTKRAIYEHLESIRPILSDQLVVFLKKNIAASPNCLNPTSLEYTFQESLLERRYCRVSFSSTRYSLFSDRESTKTQTSHTLKRERKSRYFKVKSSREKTEEPLSKTKLNIFEKSKKDNPELFKNGLKRSTIYLPETADSKTVMNGAFGFKN